MKARRVVVNDRMQRGYTHQLIDPRGATSTMASWIYHKDPRGWFQWYCRYYVGRRSLDDERQIRRWRQMRRHIAQIKHGCEPLDLDCRRRQRQALLHWAYGSRRI